MPDKAGRKGRGTCLSGCIGNPSAPNGPDLPRGDGKLLHVVFPRHGVTFQISGGSEKERDDVSDALTRVVGTPIGQEMLKALSVRREKDDRVRFLRVNLIKTPTGSGTPGSQFINISRRAEILEFMGGPGDASLERKIAHELGHAAMGLDDDGPHNMNNVRTIENPLMHQLNDFNDRLTARGWLVPGR